MFVHGDCVVQNYTEVFFVVVFFFMRGERYGVLCELKVLDSNRENFGFGADKHGFGLIAVELKFVFCHPVTDIVYAL